MRKLWALAGVFLCCAGLPVAAAREWIVDSAGDADFATLQSAIDDSRVATGDSILVLPGTYVENVVVPDYKILDIRSRDGAAATIIQPAMPPAGSFAVTVFVKSASVLRGFTVADNPALGTEKTELRLPDVPLPGKPPARSAAICLSGPAHVVDCVARGHRFGIVSGCPSGAAGRPPLVERNETFGNEVGISVCETTSIIRDNRVHDNSWIGILCAHAACGEVVNNLIWRNGEPGREDTAGILCWQSYHIQPDHNLEVLIAFNTIDSNAGDGIRCVWEFGGLNQPTILGNIITRNEGYGVYSLLDNSDPQWSHCLPRPSVRRCNLWGNGLGVTFGVARRTMCLTVDPQFEEGYCLAAGSGCRDGGGPAFTRGSTSADEAADVGRMDLGFHYPIQTTETLPD